MRDPVFFYDGASPAEDKDLSGLKDPGWYFWDETWSTAYGPYTTEEAARQALKTYGESL